MIHVSASIEPLCKSKSVNVIDINELADVAQRLGKMYHDTVCLKCRRIVDEKY
jgi:hypothetical protein